MLLQSNNADVFFDQTREELRITSVHKYPGFFQSHKIVGAVTVAFFDKKPPDEEEVSPAVQFDHHPGIPASLSFLHLPTNVNHQPSKTKESLSEAKNDSSQTFTNSFNTQAYKSLHPSISHQLAESDSMVEMHSNVGYDMTSNSKSNSTSLLLSSSSRNPATLNRNKAQHTNESPKRNSENVKKDDNHIHNSKSWQLLSNPDNNEQHGTPCDSSFTNDQDSTESDKLTVVVKKEPVEEVDAKNTDKCSTALELESSLCGDFFKREQFSENMDEMGEDVPSDIFTQAGFDNDLSNDEDTSSSEVPSSLHIQTDAIQCKPVVSNLAKTKQSDKTRQRTSINTSCLVCKNVLQSKEDLVQHSELHCSASTGIKCVVCRKGFSHIWALKRHSNFHFSSSCYNCPLCDKNMHRIDLLKQHMRKVHPGSEHLLKASLSKLILLQKPKNLGSRVRTAMPRSSEVQGRLVESASAVTDEASRGDNRDENQLNPGMNDKGYNEKPLILSKCISSQISDHHHATEPQYTSTCVTPTVATQSQPTELITKNSNIYVQGAEDTCIIVPQVGNKQKSFTPNQHISSVLLPPMPSHAPASSNENVQGQIESKEANLYCDIVRKKQIFPLCVPKQKHAHEPRKKDIRNFSCSLCQKIIQDLPEFMEHVNNHNTIQGPPFTCPVCLKIFQCEINLKQHASNHMLSKLYMCPVCQAEISRIDNFKRHITMCHQMYAKSILENFDSSLYLVSIKGKQKGMAPSKSSISNRSAEFDLKHSPQDLFSPFKSYSRNPFSIGMSSVSDLSQYIHSMTLPTTPGNYPEYDQQQRVSDEKDSTSPVVSGGQVLPYLASYCSKPVFPQSLTQTENNVQTRATDHALSIQSSADDSVKEMHSRLSPLNLLNSSNTQRLNLLQCLYCGSRIHDDSDFISHARRHRSSEDKMICPLCFSEFAQEDDLQQHCRVHLLDNSAFSCPACGVKFKRKDIMLKHVKTCQESMDTDSCHIESNVDLDAASAIEIKQEVMSPNV